MIAVRERIEGSGHAEMIKDFFGQFFIPSDNKKNTRVIKGCTNSGKTKFMERLIKIFPCEQYIQQHKSNFSIDYSKSKSFDHMKYFPAFILIDEGAYSDLFDHGHIADTKRFFEGMGKAL